MKILFLSICLILAGSVFAQTVSEEDLFGVYKAKSNDPMGGSTTVFLPNNTFVIAYFGGVQKGTWELRDDKILLSVSTEPQFALYGRKRNILGDKTQIDFSMDADNGAMVGLDSNNKNSLKPVFNRDANCFSHPYTFTQDEKLIQLHAAQAIREWEDSNSQEKPYAQVYHFNIFGAYNDLILINLSSEYTTKATAQAMYKEGKLYMETDDEGMAKRPLESLSEEDSAFIKQFSNKSLFPNQLLYGDEFFPYTENPSQEELKPYNRIDVLEISRQDIEIQEGSFFTATCDED
ncbi:MAG: hypothetical protein ACTIJ9_09635 [Aequorivita sp.]